MEKFTDCVIGESQKFYSNGKVKEFLGNSFLCHLPQCEFTHFAYWVQAQTEQFCFAYKFALLPVSSFHMTVHHGVCDTVRRKSQWINDLVLGTPLYQVNRYLISKIHLLPKKNKISMKVDEVCIQNGDRVFFKLSPNDEETANYLKLFKQIMRIQIGMNDSRSENHYFYMSLSYMLIYLEQDELDLLQGVFDNINKEIEKKQFVIDFNAVEFCIFNDIHHFSTIVKI